MPKAKGLLIAFIVALVAIALVNKVDAFKSLRPKSLAA